jgi:hypothetical protein
LSIIARPDARCGGFFKIFAKRHEVSFWGDRYGFERKPFFL